MRLALEVEYTSVRYAQAFDSRFAPVAADTDESVGNLRGHVAVYYFF